MQLSHVLQVVIGQGFAAEQLTAGQMAARAVVAYGVALVVVRVGRRRFMGRNSAMDAVVAVTFGSTLSRGLTGNAPLVPVLAACAALVAADWVLAAVGSRWDRFDVWVKGRAVDMVRDGRLVPRAMAGLAVSRRDLAEGLRLHGNADDPSALARASLERNGQFSVTPAHPPSQSPRVVEVRVEAGVQTVRIEVAG